MFKFKVNDGNIATNPPANVQAYVFLAYAVHYAYCFDKMPRYCAPMNGIKTQLNPKTILKQLIPDIKFLY